MTWRSHESYEELRGTLDQPEVTCWIWFWGSSVGRQCCCCHSLKSKVNDCQYGICVSAVTQPTKASFNGSTAASQRSQIKLVCVTPQKLLDKTGWIKQRDCCGVLQAIYPSSKALGTRSIPILGFSDLESLHRFHCRDYLKCILLQNPTFWGLGLWDSQPVPIMLWEPCLGQFMSHHFSF